MAHSESSEIGAAFLAPVLILASVKKRRVEAQRTEGGKESASRTHSVEGERCRAFGDARWRLCGT